MNKLLLSLAVIFTLSLCASPNGHNHASTSETKADSVANDSVPKILALTEADYREVAEELGVETAAIKAVVEIEAGVRHEGFSAPGTPLINFDLAMFRRFAGRKGINLTSYYNSHHTVFNTRRRLTQLIQNERLSAALSIDRQSAIEGTFWGMFQIGGFNWKKCGVSDINEFVDLMSQSERQQLELFGQFITNTGLLTHLRNKNWSAFARGYNGPSYAKRGYHTRLANAYRKHKLAESQATEIVASDSLKQTDQKIFRHSK